MNSSISFFLLVTALAPQVIHAGMVPFSFHIDYDTITEPLTGVPNEPLTPDDAIHSHNGHFFTVGPDHTPATPDDIRVRFWGVNLLPPLTFPVNKEAAEQLAARLALMGFNLARLTGLDQRRKEHYRSLIDDSDSRSYPRLNKQNLKALDLLFDAFQAHGIYVDLNLKVDYTFDPQRDCLIDSNSVRKCVPDPEKTTTRYTQSGVMPGGSSPLDLFDETMVGLQKTYFRSLLERYRNHPALALIEINNENSLIESFWGTASELPPLYAEQLDFMWNQWVAHRYNDIETLRNAWSVPIHSTAAGEMIRNGNFSQHNMAVPDNWVLTQRELDGQRNWGNWRVTADQELEISIHKTPRKFWYLYLGQENLPIQADRTYRLEFTARAEPAREFRLAMQGLSTTPVKDALPANTQFSASEKQQRYSVCFTAGISDNRTRFTVLPAVKGSGPGKIWFDDFSIQEATSVVLEPAETLAALDDPLSGTISRPRQDISSECPRSQLRTRDYLTFLAELEHDYYREMSSFIHEDLAVNRPVTGTQVDYGGLLGQKNMADLMDFIDIHYYWDYPKRFFGDNPGFRMLNKTMLSDPAGSIIGRIMAARVKGLPLTISEFSPNQLNQFAQDGWVFTAAYAAIQDIDAIMAFTYYDSGGDIRHKLYPKQLLHTYNILGDTRAEALMPTLATLFRRGDIRSARNTIEVNLGPDDRLRQVIEFGPRAILPFLLDGTIVKDRQDRPFDILLGLKNRIVLNHLEQHSDSGQTAAFSLAEENPVYSGDGQLAWFHAPNNEKPWIRIDTPKSKVVTGYIGRKFSLTGIEISGLAGDEQFGTVTVTSLDGRAIGDSSDLLVTTIGTGKNRNLSIVPFDSGVTSCVAAKNKQCLHEYWHPAAGEFLVTPNPVELTLKSRKEFTAQRLGTSGQILGEIDSEQVPDGIRVRIGGVEDNSPWYRIRENVAGNRVP